MRLSSRTHSLYLGAMLLLFAGLRPLHAQSASDYQVKAAYLLNFAKFVEWPPSEFATPESPIQLCVLNDRSFYSELNRIVKDKAIAGRPVTAVAVQDAEQSRECQMLFVNSLQAAHRRRIFDLLREASVLTVGDSSGFVQEGGIINFVMRDDHIQLEVNHGAANRVGIHISSRLLRVAKLVIE